MRYLTGLFMLMLFAMSSLSACGKMDDPKTTEIKQVIRWYDDALTKAYKERDIKPLVGLASERELNRVSMLMLNLKIEKRWMEAELKDLKFKKIDFINDKKVAVWTLEKWKYRYIEKRSKNIDVLWEEIEYEMFYDLIKLEGKWVVGLSMFASDVDEYMRKAEERAKAVEMARYRNLTSVDAITGATAKEMTNMSSMQENAGATQGKIDNASGQEKKVNE